MCFTIIMPMKVANRALPVPRRQKTTPASPRFGTRVSAALSSRDTGERRVKIEGFYTTSYNSRYTSIYKNWVIRVTQPLRARELLPKHSHLLPVRTFGNDKLRTAHLQTTSSIRSVWVAYQTRTKNYPTRAERWAATLEKEQVKGKCTFR